ncbi:hypothetical protein [Mangrovibacillus cuniculi]|uniref:Uncharacterized protein n=1 Tax=Mangrovibacillus cuniculi TaxID=2593652 RepID=A0A7S8CCJ0_9BACI|nr:hypothetical protein [Mangrovibacillus cuniculi]QPC47475.1 hypothetical protein G8O30_11225 [Mangrovibacillus cuniculi]
MGKISIFVGLIFFVVFGGSFVTSLISSGYVNVQMLIGALLGALLAWTGYRRTALLKMAKKNQDENDKN